MNDRQRREDLRDTRHRNPNTRRRMAAREAIRTHRRGDLPKTVTDSTDAIVDLVTDLRHLAAYLGIDFEYVLRVSDMHHHDEQAEEARELIPTH